MGKTLNSALANGTRGSPQLSNKQLNLKIKVDELAEDLANEVKKNINEGRLSDAEETISNLALKSPMHIPKSATYEIKQKEGYIQVKFKWKEGNYDYEARFHLTPPSSRKYTNEKYSWVLHREIKGIGYGKNARLPKKEIKIKNIGWIEDAVWLKIISRQKKGKITKKERRILENGHWKFKK